MDLQTLFYVVAIAFMLSVILAFILIAIAMWKLKQQMGKLPAIAKTALAGLAVAKRQQILGTVGLTVGTALIAKLKDKFFDSKSDKKS